MLLFCFEILKTLVECNENKRNKIETLFEMDQNVMNLKLHTDEHRLKQIILNFISNACKFTSSGFIRLKAKIKKDSNLLEISIKDSGIGIKEDEKKLILQEMIQMNLEEDYNTKGSGLGLSITKNLANRLKLNVGFKSVYGKGSKFFINFLHNSEANNNRSPLNSECYSKYGHDVEGSVDILLSKAIKKTPFIKEDEFPTRRVSFELIKYEFPHNSFSLNQSLSNHCGNYQIEQSSTFSLGLKNNEKDIIVVIDDHKLVRENTINLIQNVIKNLDLNNYEVREGSDGIDLLRIVINDKEGKIKYIFCDENMEYLNGSETIKILRNLEANKKIIRCFIVSVTALDDNSTRLKILESGFDYVFNSFTPHPKIYSQYF